MERYEYSRPTPLPEQEQAEILAREKPYIDALLEGRYAHETLVNGLAQDEAEEAEMQALVDAAKVARQELVMMNYGLVLEIARKRQSSTVELDELVQIGLLVLLEKVDRYDPSYKKGLGQFASRAIEGAMIDFIVANNFGIQPRRSVVSKFNVAKRKLAEVDSWQPTSDFETKEDAYRYVVEYAGIAEPPFELDKPRESVEARSLDPYLPQDRFANPGDNDTISLMSMLARRQREVMYLHLQGLNDAEIARELKISAPAVHKYKQIAARNMRRQLDNSRAA